MNKLKNLSFLLAAMLLATSFSFTACSDDDDDDDDVREQAVGNYSYTTTIYVEEDGKLESFASQLAEIANAVGVEIKESDFQDNGTAVVSKSGNDKIFIKQDGADGDQFYLNSIKAASNGFVFDVEATTIDEVKFTNYSGYKLQGESATYGGGFINNKLEFYIYTSMEELLDAVLDEETAEDLATFLVENGYTEEDAKEDAKQKVVFEYTFTKK